MVGLVSLVLTPSGIAASTPPRALEVVFADHFETGSRGERRRNTVVDAPPIGMGYTTDVPFGFVPNRWIVVYSEAQQARRGFWCIPERTNGTVETFKIQAGRAGTSSFAERSEPERSRDSPRCENGPRIGSRSPERK